MDQVQTEAIKKYQQDVENEYMKMFEEYVGVSPYSEDKYNEHAYKEILARTLVFWQTLNEKLSQNNPELEYRKQYTQSMFDESINFIKETMTPEQNEYILNRTEQLHDKERCTKIEQCKKKLNVIKQVSNEMYKNFANDIKIKNIVVCKSAHVLFTKIINTDVEKIQTTENHTSMIDCFEPTIWLLNQDLMEKFTKEYIEYVNTLDDSEELLENSMIKYFKCMCKSYPSNYGNILREKYNLNECCDAAELLYEMTK